MSKQIWTYKNIQKKVKEIYGFVPKTCWIADVKSMCGLKVRVAPNRIDVRQRKYPCPTDKIEKIKEVLQQLGIIELIFLISKFNYFT